MRRIVCREVGPPEHLRLEVVPDPKPGPGEVLVKVHAAGVSFVDGLIVGGMYQRKLSLPFTPGLVGAGEVLTTGAGVPDLAAHRRVVRWPNGRSPGSWPSCPEWAATGPTAPRAARAQGLRSLARSRSRSLPENPWSPSHGTTPP